MSLQTNVTNDFVIANLGNLFIGYEAECYTELCCTDGAQNTDLQTVQSFKGTVHHKLRIQSQFTFTVMSFQLYFQQILIVIFTCPSTNFLLKNIPMYFSPTTVNCVLQLVIFKGTSFVLQKNRQTSLE